MFIKILFASLIMLPALCIFSEEVNWPVPPRGYASASSSIPEGTLSRSINYPTRNYNNRAFRIYMPPDYSETRSEKYPVLYLLHGGGGNENAWTSNAGHAEGNADKIMDYLYAQEDLEVTPMLVVMPMGKMTGTDDEWGNFEDVLINDLIPYVEENYNVSSNHHMRAIAGLSMGGGQTLAFGYKNPDVFTWVGGFSPAPRGEPDENIEDMDVLKADMHLHFFSAGTASGDAGTMRVAKQYHDYLDDNGVTTNLYLQSEEGLGHERETWNRSLYHFAQRIFKGATTITEKMERTQKAPLNIHKLIMGPNNRNLYITRTGAGTSEPQFFSLDGRHIAPFQLDKTVLEINGNK